MEHSGAFGSSSLHQPDPILDFCKPESSLQSSLFVDFLCLIWGLNFGDGNQMHGDGHVQRTGRTFKLSIRDRTASDDSSLPAAASRSRDPLVRLTSTGLNPVKAISSAAAEKVPQQLPGSNCPRRLLCLEV
jgi:hypothetical protein